MIDNRFIGVFAVLLGLFIVATRTYGGKYGGGIDGVGAVIMGVFIIFIGVVNLFPKQCTTIVEKVKTLFYGDK